MDGASLIQTVDFSLCAREPIRTPGGIQPHGFLLAVSADAMILQASDNAARFTGVDARDLLGKPLEAALGKQNAAQLAVGAADGDGGPGPVYQGTIQLENGCNLDALSHRRGELTVYEFEKVERDAADFRLMYRLVGGFLARLSDIDSVDVMSGAAADKIREATGFGRVLVYRFDEHQHGEVIAESLAEGYHSYDGQRFPASDIPPQARELYIANRIRLIADADYVTSRLLPERDPLTGESTDLSYAALRSVSPVHLQYMKNMGTLASMSISLVVRGKLWGLISCHHHEPRFVPFEVRAACEQLGQILSLRIESREDEDEYDHRLELRRMLVNMLAGLSHGKDFLSGMESVSHELLRFAGASGAAIAFEGTVATFGDTPADDDITQLVEWLSANTEGTVFHTDRLGEIYPGGRRLARNASGILALPISQIHRHYLIWFRPEVVRTIEWAGDPHEKGVTTGATDTLTPRRSFAAWRETVHNTCLPWRVSEIEIALEFRTALLGIVLERAEQMAELAEDLGRANKELEAFSYSVSHDLRAPLRHIVGFSDLLLEFEGAKLSERGSRFLVNIKESARFAGRLVDDLLSFSQMGRASLRPCLIDMKELVASAIDKLANEIGKRDVVWHIGDLPQIEGDPMFLNLAVHNLLSNAIKYTSTRPQAVISISARAEDDCNVFTIRDNGVGFNMEYAHKLFGVFQRLHRMEEFQGTGIGLANVRRIVERHGGHVWAHGEVDHGAEFSFSIPKQLPQSP